MPRASSVSSGTSQDGRSISLTAFSVPTRQGVHWPQLSSSKNRIRFSVAALRSSWSERITTAWRADEAAVRLELAEVERDVGHRGRQDAARGAARQVGAERVASAMPPQNSSISSRAVMPAGASLTPGSLTRPETE